MPLGTIESIVVATLLLLLDFYAVVSAHGAKELWLGRMLHRLSFCATLVVVVYLYAGYPQMWSRYVLAALVGPLLCYLIRSAVLFRRQIPAQTPHEMRFRLGFNRGLTLGTLLVVAYAGVLVLRHLG